MEKFYVFLENKASTYLTRRKANRLYEKTRKRTFLGELWSWVDALLFAIVVVILINQYLFQLFVIPSPSMVHTLEVGDRVFVNKLSYGLEVYPGGPKVFNDNRRVHRDQIITFYNPEYTSKGPFFDILSQALYMGTLTLVNIDRKSDGTPEERLYVKRAVGLGGETVHFVNGDIFLHMAGETGLVAESDFRETNGLSSGPHRDFDLTTYKGIKAWGQLFGYQEAGVKNVPAQLKNDYETVQDQQYPGDMYEFEHQRTKAREDLDPSDMFLRSDNRHYENGIYVPTGRILPCGDNRDNSRDGRYFGPVRESRINGRVIGRFWPLNRISSLVNK